METRFLETYLLVARHGSLAEAARQLGVTPAAVNQRMQALEAEVGQPLLARAGRTVKPTPAGLAIIEQAWRVVEETRRLRWIAQQDDLAGEVRIGAISTAMTGLLPRALRRLTHRLPQLELFLLPGSSADLYAALNNGRIDAAVLVRPPFPLPKTVEWHLLRSEPMRLIVPETMADGDPRQLLSTEPVIRYDRNNWGGRLAADWLERAGLRPREWLELDQLEAIAVMVSNGLGISILPEWAPPWPEGVRVARLSLPGPLLSRDIGLIWARDRLAPRLTDELIQALNLPGEANGAARPEVGRAR